MDVDKFKALTELVAEARDEDRRTFDEQTKATAEWKQANARLTERKKVLDDWLLSVVNEATGIGK